MSSELQGRIIKALFAALRPLARALLRAGIGYKEFSEAAKAAFISEATEGFGIRGRDTNASRVAIMTGISRKEVKRIRDLGLESLNSKSLDESPASVVLSRWYTDEKYIDESGEPKVLDFDKGDVSFVQLVKSCAGDLPAGALRTELKRVGAIVEDSEKRLTVKSRHFVPKGLDDRLIIGLEDVVGADLETLAFNCDPGLDSSTRYHRVTSVDGLTDEALARVNDEAKARLTTFADQFDDYLISHLASEKSPQLSGKSVKQAGIGMFYFEREIK